MNILSQTDGKNWSIIHGDCVEATRGLPDKSVGLSVFSPPFSSLYTYSNSDRDMGNCRDDVQFFEHFRFLVEQLFRITKPGRICAVHCMDLPTSKQHHGVIGLRDFPGDIIRQFCDSDAERLQVAIAICENQRLRYMELHDAKNSERMELMKFELRKEAEVLALERKQFIYHSKVTIWKDPVTAMQRTKALGLLHKQVKKDSCMSRQGVPDYLVVMRMPGTNPDPVTHDNDSFPVERWQRFASPVWASKCGTDAKGFSIVVNPSVDNGDTCGIDAGCTLQRDGAREADDERHICPLQLEVIERAVALWSNPGDVVFSPFTGIGSEGYQAVKMGRKFIGIELKESYYKVACDHLRMAESESRDLFDLGKEAV